MKSYGLPLSGRQDDVAGPVGDLHLDQIVILGNVHGVDSASARVAEGGKQSLFDCPILGGHHHKMLVVELPHRHEGGDAFLTAQIQHVDYVLTLG